MPNTSEVIKIINRMRELLTELEQTCTYDASFDLQASYNLLKQAVRRSRCEDLED